MTDNSIFISSRQNPRIKRLCSLSDKKARETEGLFRFDGIKLLEEAIVCGITIEEIYVRETLSLAVETRLAKSLCKISEDRVIYVADHVFDKITEEKSPEGIITVAKHIDKFRKIVKIYKEEFLERDSGVLIIESVRDPGNIGTMIRSAVSLGIDKVIISSDCADLYNPKTIRAAMGALFKISVDKISADALPEAIKELREIGYRVFAAALDERAEMLGDVELFAKDCFVIGNEGHGLSKEVIEACDGSVMIPMRDDCESLNAAAASVILMWEMRRARQSK